MKRSFIQVDANLAANKRAALSKIHTLHSQCVGELGTGDIRVIKAILNQVNEPVTPHTGFVLPLKACLTPSLNSKRFKDRLHALSKLGVFKETVWYRGSKGRNYFLHRAEPIFDQEFHTKSYERLTAFHRGRAEKYPAKAKKTTEHFTKSNELFKQLLMLPEDGGIPLPYRGLYFRGLRLTTQEALARNRIRETFRLSQRTTITIASHSPQSLMTLADYRVVRALFVLVKGLQSKQGVVATDPCSTLVVPTLEIEKILGYSYPGSKTSRRKVNEILTRIHSTQFEISLNSTPDEIAEFQSFFGIDASEEAFRFITFLEPAGYARARSNSTSIEQVSHWQLQLHHKFKGEWEDDFVTRWQALRQLAVRDNSSTGQCLFALLEMILSSAPGQGMSWSVKQIQTCIAPTFRVDRFEEGLLKTLHNIALMSQQNEMLKDPLSDRFPAQVSIFSNVSGSQITLSKRAANFAKTGLNQPTP